MPRPRILVAVSLLVLGSAAAQAPAGATSSPTQPGKGPPVSVRHVDVERFAVVSRQPIEVVMARIAAAIGHPDMKALGTGIKNAKSYAEVEKLIHSQVGPADLMEMGRFDIGTVLEKANGPTTPRSWRLIVGNPLIMKTMTERVPDAASYAPVTLLIDERPDGVHLTYDRMVSFLKPYADARSLEIAASLDAKVEGLLVTAASGEATPKPR